MGAIEEDEFLTFLSRCGKHALANERNPRGVDIQAFIAAVKAAQFSQSQLARIMHHAACFCTSVEQMRASDPSGWISVRPLAVQRVWLICLGRRLVGARG